MLSLIHFRHCKGSFVDSISCLRLSLVFSFFSSRHSSCSSQSKVCAWLTTTGTTDGPRVKSPMRIETQSVLRLFLIESCEEEWEEVPPVKSANFSCRSLRSSKRRTDDISLATDKRNHVRKWSASLSVRLSYPSKIRAIDLIERLLRLSSAARTTKETVRSNWLRCFCLSKHCSSQFDYRSFRQLDARRRRIFLRFVFLGVSREPELRSIFRHIRFVRCRCHRNGVSFKQSARAIINAQGKHRILACIRSSRYCWFCENIAKQATKSTVVFSRCRCRSRQSLFCILRRVCTFTFARRFPLFVRENLRHIFARRCLRFDMLENRRVIATLRHLFLFLTHVLTTFPSSDMLIFTSKLHWLERILPRKWSLY